MPRLRRMPPHRRQRRRAAAAGLGGDVRLRRGGRGGPRRGRGRPVSPGSPVLHVAAPDLVPAADLAAAAGASPAAASPAVAAAVGHYDSGDGTHGARHARSRLCDRALVGRQRGGRAGGCGGGRGGSEGRPPQPAPGFETVVWAAEQPVVDAGVNRVGYHKSILYFLYFVFLLYYFLLLVLFSMYICIMQLFPCKN